MQLRLCKICSGPIPTWKNANTIYCGVPCRRAAEREVAAAKRARETATPPRRCGECAGPIPSGKRRTSRYCSARCRYRARDARRDARRAAEVAAAAGRHRAAAWQRVTKDAAIAAASVGDTDTLARFLVASFGKPDANGCVVVRGAHMYPTAREWQCRAAEAVWGTRPRDAVPFARCHDERCVSPEHVGWATRAGVADRVTPPRARLMLAA